MSFSHYRQSMDISPKQKQTQALDDIFILGIESSCDETAASVLHHNSDGNVNILSSVIASQDEQHAPFGGVVPEIAARAHLQKIESIIAQAMTDADMAYDQLSAVAATAGPGLIGGVIAGLMSAKGLSLALGHSINCGKSS